MKYILGLFTFLMLESPAYASLNLNLQGRILRPDTTPVISNNVQFKIQIRSPNGEDCLMYEEVQVLDMASSSGVFSLPVGSGTRSAAVIDGGYSFDRIFANRGVMDFSATLPSACSLGTTYTPSIGDHRKLVYSFNEGTGWQVIPATAINWTPLAVEALQVGGFKSSNLLRVADATGAPQAAPTLLPTDVTELVALLNGTSTRYVQPSSTATFSNTITFSNAPQFSGTPSSANDLTNKTYVDAAISTGVAAGLPNVGTAGTYYKVSTDSKGRVTSGASSLVASDIPSLDASKVTTGTFGGAVGINTSGNIYSLGTVTGGTVAATTLKIYNGSNFVQVSASSMSGNLNWILPSTNGSAGQVLRTDGAGNLSWIAASTGSVTGINATPPLAAGTGATPTISISQATTSTDGYLSSTDFNTFNNKLGASSTFAGDVSGVSSSTVLDKLKGVVLSISALTSGNFLKYNGANWINANLSNADITTGLGFAPVNKAGDSMSGLLVLSADPSATLGASTKQYVDASTTTAAANYIRKDGTVAFTGPQSMGSNKLTTVADPTLAQDAATKNYADTKILGKVATAPAAGQDGQSLRWNNGSSAWDYYTPTAGIGYNAVNKAGDTMTGALISAAGTAAAPSFGVGATTLGLFSGGTNILGFSTAGTERMRVDATGNVGVGTLSPSAGGTAANSARTYLTVKGSTGSGIVQLTSSEADADGVNLGNLEWVDSQSTDGNKRTAYISVLTSGTVATNRGSYMAFATRNDGGTASSERARITNTGDMGIGTINVTARLDVKGSTSDSTALGFNVKNSGGTGLFAVRNDGNVGIGTASPAAKLDIADTGTTTSAIIVPRAGAFTGTTVNGMVRYNSTSNLFEFYQNGAWVNYTTVSDARLKKNVVSVTQGLDIVNQLHPVFYDWDKNNPRTETFGDKHQVGFIAQEVEKVLPEVVDVGEDSYRSVQYGKIVSVVVAAVKELYNKFLGLDEQLATQARQIATVHAESATKADKTVVDAKVQKLESENAKLKQENEAIKARLEKIEKALDSK